MVYFYATILTATNLLLWVGILFNLPGTWLMVLGALLLDWLQPGTPMFSPGVLFGAAGIALSAEILEFALGATGARRAGGSRRGAALAIGGGIVGAILGTGIPLPVLGTLIGACVGAFAGSLAGDLWAGRRIEHSVDAGRGAAVGRFWGTVVKLGLGGVILIVLSVAAYTT